MAFHLKGRIKGKYLITAGLRDKQFIQGFIADSYIDIQTSRLMTIHCAEQIASGADARTEISALRFAQR